MVQMRLGRSLDSIAFGGDLRTVARQLTDGAAREGWASALLAAAMDSRPANAGLRNVGEEIGLIASAPVRELERSASGHIDPDRWRSMLGVHEARVCRIQLPDGSS